MNTSVSLFVYHDDPAEINNAFLYIDMSFRAGVACVCSLCNEDDRVALDITVDPDQDETKLHWRLQTLMANLKAMGFMCELLVVTRQKAADTLLYEGVEYEGTYLYGYKQ